MGERTQYTPGTFSWADLTTPDQDAAKAFYSALFGWEITDMPVDENSVYSMAAIDGTPVAAISPQPRQQRENNVPPLWNSYITVTDADATVERARELGANIHAPAFDVMTAGRTAVIQDPQGAYVLAWQPRDHIGAGIVNTPGTITWNELGTPDMDGSAHFYGELFGWTTTAMEGSEMPYLVINTSDGRGNGGMRQPMPPGTPPSWLVYFGVEDADAGAARVTELGGQVLGDPFDIGPGRIAIVSDPQGGVLALYSGHFDD
jgi:hypothetical protein